MKKGFNLMQYVHYLVANKLNGKYYSVDDCAQQIHLALWTHKSGKFQKYYDTNTVPEGDDLKLLKSICHNQKLAYLNRENKQCPYEARKYIHSKTEETNND